MALVAPRLTSLRPGQKAGQRYQLRTHPPSYNRNFIARSSQASPGILDYEGRSHDL